jgi:hypothetical protein
VTVHTERNSGGAHFLEVTLWLRLEMQRYQTYLCVMTGTIGDGILGSGLTSALASYFSRGQCKGTQTYRGTFLSRSVWVSLSVP